MPDVGHRYPQQAIPTIVARNHHLLAHNRMFPRHAAVRTFLRLLPDIQRITAMAPLLPRFEMVTLAAHMLAALTSMPLFMTSNTQAAAPADIPLLQP